MTIEYWSDSHMTSMRDAKDLKTETAMQASRAEYTFKKDYLDYLTCDVDKPHLRSGATKGPRQQQKCMDPPWLHI